MIPLFKVFMPLTAHRAVEEVLYSGYIGEGEKVKEFEKELIPFTGNPHVLTTSSGTAAIQLALRLTDIGFDDEVITTPMTCSATNEPILMMGAKVVWADINPRTGNIDPNDVEKKVTPRTKAIICVDWGGYPCDFKELNDIAREHGLNLIEDACHAHGASYRGMKVGSHCDFSCFSFQAVKHITTVDGGMLTCRRKGDYDRAKRLRWFGIDRDAKQNDLRCEMDIKEYGYKFHMNDVAAAIGLEQLKFVDLQTCRDNAEYYNKRGLALEYKDDRQSSYWLYTIRVKDRDYFTKWAKEHRVMTSKVHVRNDEYSMFKESKVDLPGVDEFYAEQVSIPVGWWVSPDDRKLIAEMCNLWQMK